MSYGGDGDGAGFSGQGPDHAPGVIPLAATLVVRVRVAYEDAVREYGAREAGDQPGGPSPGGVAEVARALDPVHVRGGGLDGVSRPRRFQGSSRWGQASRSQSSGSMR